MLDAFLSTSGLGSSTPSPPIQVRFGLRKRLLWKSTSIGYNGATGTPSANPCQNSMPCTYLIEYFECLNRRSNQSLATKYPNVSARSFEVVSQQQINRLCQRRCMYVPMMEYLRPKERKKEREEERGGLYTPSLRPPITHEEVIQGHNTSEGSTCVSLPFLFLALAVLGGHACMHSSIYPAIDIGQLTPPALLNSIGWKESIHATTIYDSSVGDRRPR